MDEKSQRMAKNHGGYWGEHPDHLVADWQAEVENGATRAGYWAWVQERVDDAVVANFATTAAAGKTYQKEEEALNG
ncbi:MAG: hypothetical protein D4R73_02110 [Deltaproteobacteria bacterium]|nr:MAG: hypothetical protein D4R73_02110 [Deltaproteobacteria bacterium]